MNKILTTFLILTFAVGTCFAQSNDFVNPDSILIGNKNLPKVLLVGSWHFSYPGLDAHKAEDKDKINIYSDKRQKELKELLDYLSTFKPTKIVVESGRNTGYIDKIFERHYFGGDDEISKKYTEFYNYKTKMTVKKRRPYWKTFNI